MEVIGLAQKISHKKAVDIIRRYVPREWGEVLHSVEKPIGAPVIPDVVTFNEKKKWYTLCEVKTNRDDLQRAQYQLSRASQPFLDNGYPVSRFIAVTRDLYKEMVNILTWDDFVKTMKREGIGILVVYVTKVEIGLPALIQEPR